MNRTRLVIPRAYFTRILHAHTSGELLKLGACHARLTEDRSERSIWDSLCRVLDDDGTCLSTTLPAHLEMTSLLADLNESRA
jgi:hypothetical protein